MKYMLRCALMLFCIACAPTTRITASWKSGSHPAKGYRKIFIAALMSGSVIKSTLENDMAAMLEKQGIRTTTSINEFPPHFAKDSIPREELMRTVRKDGAEAILTISILKKETESRYVSGGYSPMTYGYYGSFWGYYRYWYPYTYSPSYYTTDEIYYLEANLYNSANELLLWSAQTRTYAYDGITSFSKEFAATIVQGMKRDSIL